MLPTKFRFIWLSGFRGEDFQKLANPKQELPVVAMFVNGLGKNQDDRTQMIPTKFRFIWPSGFRGDNFFQKSTNQKQDLSVAAMFVNESGRNQQSLQRTFQRCFLTSYGLFGQTVSEKNFKNQPIRNKNCLWWPCLLMDREESSNQTQRLLTDQDEMSNLYRGPPKDASYQVSVHLAKRFQRRRFLEIDQSETRIAATGNSCF